MICHALENILVFKFGCMWLSSIFNLNAINWQRQANVRWHPLNGMFHIYDDEWCRLNILFEFFPLVESQTIESGSCIREHSIHFRTTRFTIGDFSSVILNENNVLNVFRWNLKTLNVTYDITETLVIYTSGTLVVKIFYQYIFFSVVFILFVGH